MSLAQGRERRFTLSNYKIGISRAINRFERAVERKAFEGTIPWDEDAAVAEHRYIDNEYKLAKKRLREMLEGRYYYKPRSVNHPV